MKIEEQALIREAQRGSIPAYEALVRRYDRQVMQLALNMVGNLEDAEDLYQDVFIRVFRKLNSFDFRSEFSTWLFRVTTNTCINFQRARQRKKRWLQTVDKVDTEMVWQDTIQANEQTPEETTLHNEFSRELDSALQSLSGRQRTVFIMRYYQEYKLKEIAEILGCSLGTVKNYLFRATRKMQKQLHEYGAIEEV